MARARGAGVAAVFYTLCEVVGVDPRAYLLRGVHAAIARPGAITLPEDLKPANGLIAADQPDRRLHLLGCVLPSFGQRKRTS